jgi:hypothetical protein
MVAMTTWPDLPPLDPATTLAVLSMIDRNAPGRWADKLSICSYVASRFAGDWFTSKEVYEWIGLPEGSVRRMIVDLDERRVLLRAGERRWWGELNPNLGAWQVPWVCSPFTLRQRVAFHADRAITAPSERFIARALHARYQFLIARQEGARSHLARVLGIADPCPDRAAHELAEEPRDHEKPPPGYRAKARPFARSANKHRAESQGSRAVITGHFPEEVSSLGGDDACDLGAPSPGSEGGGSGSSSPGGVTVEVLDELRGLFKQQLNAAYLEGKPRALFERIVRPHTVERFRQLVPLVPEECKPGSAMEWIAERINNPTWTPARERAFIEHQVDDLRQQIRACAYDEDGRRAELEAKLHRRVDMLNTLPFEEQAL